MAVAEPGIRRVAIVDDNVYHADAMGELVREAGFEPIVLETPFGPVKDLVRRVRQQADGVICDHRLRGMARFTGAQAVASLVEQKIPAVLVTQYVDIDADVSIRLWRHLVPVLLSRDDADPDKIKEGLDLCLQEIQGVYMATRRRWRTLIEIDSITNESSNKVVDVRIPSWNPHKLVRFPLALVPSVLREQVTPGGFLFAMVNIGAEKPEDLYFHDFTAAPGPATEDSLG